MITISNNNKIKPYESEFKISDKQFQEWIREAYELTRNIEDKDIRIKAFVEKMTEITERDL